MPRKQCKHGTWNRDNYLWQCSKLQQKGSRYCQRHNAMKLQPKKMSQRRHCGFGSCRRNRRSGSDYCQRHKHTENIAVTNPDESRTCPTTEATPEEKVASVTDQATAAKADADTTEEAKSTTTPGPLINPADEDLRLIMYKKNSPQCRPQRLERGAPQQLSGAAFL